MEEATKSDSCQVFLRNSQIKREAPQSANTSKVCVGRVFFRQTSCDNFSFHVTKRPRPAVYSVHIRLIKSIATELCKNIPAKFQESLSKCSAAHPKNALGRNISASLSQNLAECFYTTLYVGSFIWPILGRLTQSWSGYHNKDKFSL